MVDATLAEQCNIAAWHRGYFRNKHVIAKWFSTILSTSYREILPNLQNFRALADVRWFLMRGGWQAQAPLAVTFRFHVTVMDCNA